MATNRMLVWDKDWSIRNPAALCLGPRCEHRMFAAPPGGISSREPIVRAAGQHCFNHDEHQMVMLHACWAFAYRYVPTSKPDFIVQIPARLGPFFPLQFQRTPETDQTWSTAYREVAPSLEAARITAGRV